MMDRKESMTDYTKLLADREKSIADFERWIKKAENRIPDFGEILARQEKTIADLKKSIGNGGLGQVDYAKLWAQQEKSGANLERSIGWGRFDRFGTSDYEKLRADVEKSRADLQISSRAAEMVAAAVEKLKAANTAMKNLSTDDSKTMPHGSNTVYKGRIKRPPLTFLFRLANFLPPKLGRCLVQEILDVHLEYYESIHKKEIWRARLIIGYYCTGLGWSVIMWISDKVRQVLGINIRKE
jgi:hypothetical protein